MLPAITNKYEGVISSPLQEIQVALDGIILDFVFKIIMGFLFIIQATLADLYNESLFNKQRKKHLLVQKPFEYRTVAI